MAGKATITQLASQGFVPPRQEASRSRPGSFLGSLLGPLASSQLGEAGKLFPWQPEQLLWAHCSVPQERAGAASPSPPGALGISASHSRPSKVEASRHPMPRTGLQP